MNLEQLIRAAGEDWLIDWYAPNDQALPYLQELLLKANARLQQRPHAPGDAIDEDSLVRGYEQSPHKIKAFLQAMGETDSPDMLVMAWKLIQGAEIAAAELHYQLQHTFTLRVQLVSPEDGTTDEYESQNIDDAAIFRHFGILKMGNRPVFDGFYALQR